MTVAQAAAEWPGRHDAPWVRYDNPYQRKSSLGCRTGDVNYVRNDWPSIPRVCAALLRQMMAWDVGDLLGIRDRLMPDTLLWGAGLHEMRRGDFLGRHLDADRHPLTGMERRANAILFLPPWEKDWGGALCLAGQAAVLPVPGRAVLFATDDESWHGVAPLNYPEGVARKTLAVYWWSLPRGEGKRPRAQFRGES